MLNKAEKMYRQDIQSIKLSKGQSIDEIQRQDSIDAITQKLNMLRDEKQKAITTKEEEYVRDTQIIKAFNQNQLKSDIVLRKQQDELDNNYTYIDNMKGDILTVRRQVEISMNDTLKRNNNVFLLKLLFMYLLVMIIPIILINNENISTLVGTGVMSTISGIFVLSVIWNFYQHRNRNSLRSSLRQFTTPTIEKVLKDDPLTEQDKLQMEKTKQTPLNKLDNLLESCIKDAVKEQNYTEALYCQDKRTNIKSNISEGNLLGGYISEYEIEKDINLLLSDSRKQVADQQEKNKNKLDNIKRSITNSGKNLVLLKNKKETRDKESTEINNKIKTIMKSMTEMNNQLKDI